MPTQASPRFLVLCLWMSVMLGSQPAVSKDDEHHDWPMYGRNLAHTFSTRSSAITEGNVSSLKLRWTFATGDAVTASPAVVDGVVYVGPHAVPAAREALEQARAMGMRLAFVTNNAARPPGTVAQHLTELGIPASAAEVVT